MHSRAWNSTSFISMVYSFSAIICLVYRLRGLLVCTLAKWQTWACIPPRNTTDRAKTLCLMNLISLHHKHSLDPCNSNDERTRKKLQWMLEVKWATWWISLSLQLRMWSCHLFQVYNYIARKCSLPDCNFQVVCFYPMRKTCCIESQNS